MKKLIVVVMMLMLCLSMVGPVFATENGFVPSITYKGGPQIVPVPGMDGVVGIVYNLDGGATISYIEEDCMVVVPYAEIENYRDVLGDEVVDRLKAIYAALMDGSMTIPYEKVPGYNGEEMVILELFEADWLCGDVIEPENDHDHPEEVRPDGVVYDVTFDLGVAPDQKVIVMTYNDGQWNPIVATKNNGDGTVTCTFEHFCPIVISVPTGEGTTPPQTGDTSNLWIWAVVMLAAMASFVTVAMLFRRQVSGKK